MDLLEIKSFIRGISPFDRLEDFELEKFVENFDIVYLKQGEVVYKEGEEPEFVYFIIKGVILEQNGDETLSIYGKQDYIDTKSIIENIIKHTFVTQEETIAYTISRADFIKLVYSNDEIESYIFQSFAQKLNSNIGNQKNKELVNFMIAKVEDAYIKKLHFVPPETSIVNVAKYFHENKINSVLIKDNDGVSIITDKDFRDRAILQRLSLDLPIKTIASNNLITITTGEFLFNAQMLMTQKGIKKLVVVDKDNKPIGMIDQITIASYFASHTYGVTKLLEMATTIEELKSASDKFINIIKALVEKGVKVRYISNLLSQLNFKLYSKLFDLLVPAELNGKITLIIMGSEGRAEQILRTDQDNGFIIDDDCDVDREVIHAFGHTYTKALIDLGYTECDGGVMVSNPYWCKNVKEYKEEIFNWLNNLNEANIMNLAIFLDSVAVVGDKSKLEDIKGHIYKNIQNNQMFFAHFAKTALMFDTPLTFFKDFVVGKTLHKNELDIKKGGIFAIVHGVRVLSLENRVSETNTYKRIKELNNMGIINREMASELIESLTFLLLLRLTSRLEKMSKVKELDNYLNPSSLTLHEKDLLRDSFKVIDRFKKFLIHHFKLNMVM